MDNFQMFRVKEVQCYELEICELYFMFCDVQDVVVFNVVKGSKFGEEDLVVMQGILDCERFMSCFQMQFEW